MSISYSILMPTGQVEEALIESCFVVLGSEKLATQVYMVTPVPAKAGTTTTTTNTACISRHTHPHINNHCRFFGSITTPSSLLENMEHCFNFETSWVEAMLLQILQRTLMHVMTSSR